MQSDCSTSFKVTDFGTNRKLICDFLLVINTYLHPILHRFQVMAHYWSNFRLRKLTTSRPRWRWFPGMSGWTLLLQKLQWLCYLTLKTAWSYLQSAGQNTGMWRTDRQNCHGYFYSAYIASNADVL